MAAALPRRQTLDRVRTAQTATSSPQFRNYQGIILAEFVLAELLIAATPVASKKNPGGLSPYVPRDMTKMLATGVLFFLLSLMPVGGPGPGRLGAWFGGLILLTVGLNEAASIAGVLDIFGGTSTAAGTTGTSQASGTTSAGGRG